MLHQVLFYFLYKLVNFHYLYLPHEEYILLMRLFRMLMPRWPTANFWPHFLKPNFPANVLSRRNHPLLVLSSFLASRDAARWGTTTFSSRPTTPMNSTRSSTPNRSWFQIPLFIFVRLMTIWCDHLQIANRGLYWPMLLVMTNTSTGKTSTRNRMQTTSSTWSKNEQASQCALASKWWK